MLIVQLSGGLGNQLFQYAAGRALALRRGEPVWLDTCSYVGHAGRVYALDQFHIKAHPAPQEILRHFARDIDNSFPNRMRRKLAAWLRRPPSVVRERRPFQYDPQLFDDLNKDVFLVGHWQNEGYFREIAPQIRRELTLTAPAQGINAEMLGAISRSTSVSLHVRRGDYVANQATLAFHGTCPPDYYHRAVEIIVQRVAAPHFFVFSDDITWVKENLALPQPATYVAHNGPEAAHEDLRLLSACKHHVIANSTFSWWGAWLSDWPDKIVIAPHRWLNDPRYDASDIIPPGWLRLDVGGAK